MKKIQSLLKPAVLHAAICSSIIKCILALALLFLWNYFINQKSTHPQGIVDTGFFAAFVFFIIGAWIQYLSLDGVRPFRHLRSRKKEKSVTAWEDNLDEDERKAAGLCSNLILAVLFLIPSLLANGLGALFFR